MNKLQSWKQQHSKACLLLNICSSNAIVYFLFCLFDPVDADMPIFGQCPAQDDFYLVMCSHCSQVVKPQAFQAHYGKSPLLHRTPCHTLTAQGVPSH